MKRAAFSRRLDAVLGLARANLPLGRGRICAADKQNGSVNSGLNSATFASQICAACAVKSAVNLSSNSCARSVKFDASLNPRKILQKTGLDAKTATNLTANLARKICSPLFAVFMVCALGASLRAEPRPTQDDFNACFEKNLPAMVNVAGNGGIAITPNLIAVPKGEIPVKNYVKFDPYLGLYLVASDAKLEPVKMAEDNATKKSDWVSVTHDLNATVYGHVKAQAQALGELDALTFDVNGTGAVLSPCCKLRGIAVGGDKFVPSRYLRHFAAYKDVYYGDVGAVFEERDGKLYVKGVDPLGRGAALMAGDEILSVNGEKMQSLRELNERILFAAKGERLKFEIRRGEDVVKFSVAVSDEVKKEQKTAPKTDENITKVAPKPQPAPNTDASSVRKLYGLTFDEKLRVKSVDGESDAARFGLRVGDKLIQVGAKVVKNRKEALALIAKNRGQRLLFRRDGFDFFYNAR
ncbi:PDZ domain-containing protein [uncultured Campylobacter sp.]|uniref:DUF7488 domain-containing protein n=1 Tax=uncultured Campylobacter sp. TaxID=218934 RepID=UPI0026119383|nr:PDZ domain-containing protein [uncultured Campylobacter sp.]